ncbi:MAG: nucleotide exchange factor GrpE [Bacilli bacterium]|nr:nucleotide exchange factor GrpE [Bacilli bacterium]
MNEKVEQNAETPKKEKKVKVNKEVETLKAANALLNEKVLRLTADMQNMKRRYEEEISKLYKYEGEDFAKKLLSVIDNFERAIKLDDTNLDDELSKFLSGFKMIYGNMINILKEKGIEEIICLNEEFDPAKMDAVLTEKVEGTPSNKVIDVMQKGYIYKDKVIRPAMVKVSE